MSTGFEDAVPFDAFEMDDVDAEAPGSRGGGGFLPEGGYKFLITEVIVQNERGSTKIECEVLEAKDTGLVGHKYSEFLNWPSQDMSADANRIRKEQLLAWCYAAKTTSAEEIKARQQARKGFDSTWLEGMVGRSVLGFVKAEKAYTDKSGNEKTPLRISGRVWALDNPKGKGIPGWIGVASPAAGQGNVAAGSAAATGPAATNRPLEQPSIPANDPFGGLV